MSRTRADEDPAPPSRDVRVGHAAIGAVLATTVVIAFEALGGEPINWWFVAIGGLAGAASFYVAGSWILWAITECFRWD